MLTEEQLEVFGNRLVPIMQKLEKSVINDIARRVSKESRWTETAELQALALQEKGYSPARIKTEVMKTLNADAQYKKYVAENTKAYKEMVQKSIDEVKEEIGNTIPELYDDIGNMSFNNDLSLWSEAGKELNKTNSTQQIVEAMLSQASEDILNLTKTTGFRTANKVTATRQMFTDALDMALTKTTSGAFSYQQSVNDVVRELAKSGLRHVDYESGRTWQVDTATRNSIMTSSNQMAGKIMQDNITKTGVEKVEVSKHMGARPSHATWQGKIYTLDEFESICGYGNPTNPNNIYSYNCRHSHFPYWEGISEPKQYESDPKPTTVNGRKYTYYDATQKQRLYERQIRALKRESNALKSIGEDVTALKSNIKAKTQEYKQFSKAVGISAKTNRLSVVE